MTYKRFEDLSVWKDAIELAGGVYDLVEDRGFDGLGDLRGQLQRASLSVSNNTAEGFERGTTPELLMFLYIARGSAGETRSALRFSRTRKSLRHLWAVIEGLIPKAEAVSRQLRAWAESLQNGDIPGQRYLNEQSREEYGQRRRSVEFLEKLRQMRRPAEEGGGQGAGDGI